MSGNQERITVSVFAERYSKITNDQLKDKYVKEHVTRTYSPILNKINVLTLMNEKSVINDSSKKYIDMAVSKLNLIMAILVLYTNIEPDKSEDGTALTCDAYDILRSTGLYEKILNVIGKDIEELMSVQSYVIETWYNKNASPQAYIGNLVEAISQKFGAAAGVGMEKLSDVLDDETKLKRFMNALEKVVKKIK